MLLSLIILQHAVVFQGCRVHGTGSAGSSAVIARWLPRDYRCLALLDALHGKPFTTQDPSKAPPMADDSDFDFFVLTPSDFGDVTDILAREFFPREPLTQGTRATNVQPRKGRVADDVRTCLEAGVSVGVRHRPTGELVGVRISFIKSRAGSSPPTQPANELEALFRVYDRVMKEVDFFEERDVDKVLAMYMVGVHRDFGGRGLGKKLVERCMEKGVEKGCQLAVTTITNKFSGRIFEKLGYEVRHCLDLTSLGPEWGVDTSLMGENTTVRVMTKRLP